MNEQEYSQMSGKEYRDAVRDVIYLAGCAVNGEKPDRNRAADFNVEHLYEAAKRHQLTSITAMALESAGIRNKAFTEAKGKAIRKVILFDNERRGVLTKLEEAGIWHMPLKGCVIKDLYPMIGMRQMADNDILYDVSRSRDVRTIMEDLGFETVQYVRNAFNHDHYNKAPVFNFEMHRALFTPGAGEKIFQYYQQIRKKMVRDPDNQYGYHLTGEDFYIYMIAHEYKHYAGGGTGLRSMLDTYVYLKKKGRELDWTYIAGELEKLGISEFEEQNRTLSLHLFNREELTAQDQAMLDYILSSGTYGNWTHLIAHKVEKFGGGRRGKVKYLMSRMFLSMKGIERFYPFFYKHKILLPVLLVYRLGRGLTVRRRIVKDELTSLFRKLN